MLYDRLLFPAVCRILTPTPEQSFLRMLLFFYILCDGSNHGYGRPHAAKGDKGGISGFRYWSIEESGGCFLHTIVSTMVQYGFAVPGLAVSISFFQATIHCGRKFRAKDINLDNVHTTKAVVC